MSRHGKRDSSPETVAVPRALVDELARRFGLLEEEFGKLRDEREHLKRTLLVSEAG
jgi:hypothetical protein